MKLNYLYTTVMLKIDREQRVQTVSTNEMRDI